MNTQYFNPRMTAEEMKIAYRTLVKQYHPDLNKGIDDSFIKQINNEYSFWYARVASKEIYNQKTSADPSKDYSKYQSDVFIQSLEDMIREIYSRNLDQIYGITIELMGVFIWIAGIGVEDEEVRNIVKSLGFNGAYKYHNDGTRTYMWKWTYELRRFKADPNIDRIRERYGSQNIKRGSTQKRLA
jgi:curved DNA-binding protein CbpA